MKHKFLLDENILHFAIKGVDEYDQPDLTSMELVLRIARNCHKIVVNNFLRQRYWFQIKRIRSERRPPALEPVSVIKQIVHNSEKWSFEYADCPEIPAGVSVPLEDVEIVRLALLARVLIVTGDGPLTLAVNSAPALGIKAITPADALALARET